VVVERGRRRVAVLIPIAEYERRFFDAQALEQRRELARQIIAQRDRTRAAPAPAEALVRQIRGPLP
jgi:hypothetical protein